VRKEKAIDEMVGEFSFKASKVVFHRHRINSALYLYISNWLKPMPHKLCEQIERRGEKK